MNEFMKELKYSGYSEKDRETILIGGINTYTNLKTKERNGERPFYRPRNFKREERESKKVDKPRNWFKNQNKDGKIYGSVMFVEATKDDKLLKMLKATEETHKISDDCRIKFVSKSGIKLKHILETKNPFKSKCHASDCKPCESAVLNKHIRSNCR